MNRPGNLPRRTRILVTFEDLEPVHASSVAEDAYVITLEEMTEVLRHHGLALIPRSSIDLVNNALLAAGVRING